MSSKVRYERTGAAAVLTIDRRERRNAVDVETAALLLDGLREFEADDEARVLVLTGDGPEAFCAGADLKAMAEASEQVTSDVLDAVAARPEGPMGFSRLTPSKPTVAAIRLVPGRRPRAGALVRPANRHRDGRSGLHRAALRGPPIDADAAPAAGGGHGQGAGADPHRPRAGRGTGASLGLVNEVVPEGRHLERALETPRDWPPSRRRRCSPTAGRRSRAPGCARRRPRARGRAGTPRSDRAPRRGPLRRRRRTRGGGRGGRPDAAATRRVQLPVGRGSNR
jgi:enoyl-CoA hydratase